MGQRKLGRWLGLGAIAQAAACALIVDTSGIDEGCASGRKFCNGRCVSVNDPSYGCEPTGCEPCRNDNGVPRCDGTECVFDTCLYGFGCEQCNIKILISDDNCGACHHECDAKERCSAGVCVASEAGGAGGESGAGGAGGASGDRKKGARTTTSVP